MTNSYVFDIDGAGTWKVDVDDGTVKVTEGGTATPTPRSRASRGDLPADREPASRTPTTAYMTGKLKVEGDMGAAMKLQKLF